MQNLTVTGTDGEALVAVSDTGEEFRIPVDESVQARVRHIAATAAGSPKVSPREIQAMIRSGMSASEVADATGAALEYVERFEGPVLDERRHVVEEALRVPVKLHTPTDPLAEESQAFGGVIAARLRGLGATDARWASWKDDAGWFIKVTFVSQSIEHDARWQFDPKRHTLNPANADAVTLSQAGEITGGMIPRLRAVGVPTAQLEEEPSAVGIPTESPAPAAPVPLPPAIHPSIAAAAESTNQTADLLEVLRRRRGERESANFLTLDGEVDLEQEEDDADDGSLSTVSPFSPRRDAAPVELVQSPVTESPVDEPMVGADDLDDVAESAIEQADLHEAAPTLDGVDATLGDLAPPSPSRPRRARATMPSWDEIVFGARERDE